MMTLTKKDKRQVAFLILGGFALIVATSITHVVFIRYTLYGYNVNTALITIISITALILTFSKKATKSWKYIIRFHFCLLLYNIVTQTISQNPLRSLGNYLNDTHNLDLKDIAFYSLVVMAFLLTVVFLFLKKSSREFFPPCSYLAKIEFKQMVLAFSLFWLLYVIPLLFILSPISKIDDYLMFYLTLSFTFTLATGVTFWVSSLDEMWKSIIHRSMTFAALATGITCLSFAIFPDCLLVFQPEWAFYLICVYFSISFTYFKLKY